MDWQQWFLDPLKCRLVFKPSAIKFADASVAVVLLCGNPKLVSFKIYHGGCFTPAPSRSYISGHVSSVDVIDIDEFGYMTLKKWWLNLVMV
ncbi:hypothetical protein Tco_1444434 [Tanacetum coccineum]